MAMTKRCEKCKKDFSTVLVVNGKKRYLYTRLYCLSCSPYGEHNTQDLNDYDNNPNRVCKLCGKKFVYKGKYNSLGHRKNVCNSCKTLQHHRRQKVKAIAYKGGKCQKCGYSKCSEALCFHHLDPALKSTEISKLYNRSWKIIEAELDKCVLLCLICHAESHAENETGYSG